MSKENMLKGGEFLVKETLAQDIFTPEEFNEEQRMMAQSCREFTETQVVPQMDQLEKHDRKLLTQLLKEAGQLGLLGISIPEEYEGFGQNFVTSMLTTEEMGKGYSFAVAFAAHTGIGTLPILYYGNDAQKNEIHPKNLLRANLLGAYCLTEAEAGSDAKLRKNHALFQVLMEAITSRRNGVKKLWEFTNGR